MKDWIKNNFMRIWFSVLGGFAFGFIANLIWDNDYFVPIMILAGAVSSWFILRNNSDFKKEIAELKKKLQ